MIEALKIIVPLLIALVAIIVPLKNFQLENRKLKLKILNLSDENNMLTERINDLTLSIELDLQVFNEIKNIAEDILINTKADRFLILTATNGKGNMRFATAVYEHHKKNKKVSLSLGATGKYVKFEFDSTYKKMLKDSELYDYVELDIKNMPDSDLKSIYESENILYSDVYFLLRGKINEQNDRLFYCSVSTHSSKNFTKNEKVLIKIRIDKLRSIFKKIGQNG